MHAQSTAAPATFPGSSSPAPSANSAVQLPAPRFQPTQEAASDILTALVDPDQTLAEIAQRFHTTVDALADWLDSPHIVRRIETIERVTARRSRMIAVANERTALGLLLSIIEGHKYDEQHIPVNCQSIKSLAQRDRARATARLAASQLIRLANAKAASPAHEQPTNMQPDRDMQPDREGGPGNAASSEVPPTSLACQPAATPSNAPGVAEPACASIPHTTPGLGTLTSTPQAAPTPPARTPPSPP